MPATCDEVHEEEGLSMKRLCIFVLITCWFAGVAAQQQQVQPYDALLRSVKIYLYVQKNKDYAKAEELLKTAIANYPDPLEAHFSLGNIYNDQAKYKEMMEQYNKFAEICAKAAENKDTKLQKRCEKDKMAEQIKDIRLSSLKKNFDDGVFTGCDRTTRRSPDRWSWPNPPDGRVSTPGDAGELWAGDPGPL